jgi:hypothetical protein
MNRIRLFGFVTLLVASGIAAAQDKGATGQEVAALLRDRCVKCHSGEKPKAGLDLTSLESLARGGKRGRVVVAGKPDESTLWQVINKEKMPPKEPLPEAERALLKRWIAQGSPGLAASAKAHWAFVPPVKPTPPVAKDAGRIRTDIDRFILAALEQKGLTLTPEADRATMVRRLCFDLTGLPPTLEEITTFERDTSPDAYEKLVEKYLASPRYGERWGKYWLDAAGYAESNGYFSADSDRPHAWRYRDYVIRSFNADKPYNRFVQEQLAGDEMAGYVPGTPVTPTNAEPLIATHFLRNAPDGTAESDGNPDEVRIDRYTVLEGTLQNTMNCLLGITIQCCRCHEHKFEPIAHDEYYRLQAIYFPAYNPERWTMPKDRLIPLASAVELAEHKHRTELIDRQIQALMKSVKDFAEPLREQFLEERLRTQAPGEWEAALKAIKKPEDKRDKAEKDLAAKYTGAAAISDEDLRKRFPELAAVQEQAKKAQAAREKERPKPLDAISAFFETDPKPPVHHVLLRGQHNAPGHEVQPGVPATFCSANNQYQLSPLAPPGRGVGGEGQSVSTGRRTAFARWLTSPENPLFARVMVNRIWQHHFGVGLVATPDNLGQSGAKPSHPELLDWLACRFIESGWSVKAMHRLIVNSAVYRQLSNHQPEAQARAVGDPDNRLLSHFPLRRLDAEAVRDSMLAISGELDATAGGPFVRTEHNAEGSVIVKEGQPGARRRSVYLQQRRTQVLTMLELFDAPSIVSTCGARTTSTVPLQSLAMLNSEFARLRAAAFARRLEGEVGADAEQRINLAFRIACGREPTPEAMSASKQFVATQRTAYEKENDCEQRAWADFCQMLLASNSFMYVD